MRKEVFHHTISPERVIRGKNAWSKGKYLIASICKQPLFIGRSKNTTYLREKLFVDLKNLNLSPVFVEINKDCCEEDILALEESYKSNNCDGVICAGGGKVLDAGKLVAERVEAYCITIPLSASTCAGWTALSNIYSNRGEFINDVELKTCPKILIFDHNLVKTAPTRTLASGVADALAKWYEASVTSNDSTDALVQQAVQMARVLRDQLLLNSVEAINDPNSKAWERVSESCALTAGLIGGIGGKKCRTAAAHALHNGFTQLNFRQKSLHGEIVGFGILVQLKLEEAFSRNELKNQSRSQLVNLLKDLKVPITINSLGLQKSSNEELYKACYFACKEESEIHNMPFNVTPDILIDAIKQTDKENLLLLKEGKKETSLL